MTGVLITIVAFLVLITIVVVVHELGHFTVAKLSGIRVDGFSVGFGPRIWSVRRGETVYAIRALPVGGFVQMAGMLGMEGEADAGERNFYRATMPRRLATIVAGVVVNFVFGAVCLGITYTQSIPSSVPSGEPTSRAGIASGDVILSLGGQRVDNSSEQSIANDLHAATRAADGLPLAVVYRSPDGRTYTSTITPELVVYTNIAAGTLPSAETGQALVITSLNGAAPGTGDPASVLGSGGAVTVGGFVEGSSPRKSFSGIHLSGVRDGDGTQTGYTAAWRIGYVAQVPGVALVPAVGDGFAAIPSYVSQTLGALGQLFVHPSQASQDFAGPVGIASIAGSTIRQGWVQYLSLIGLISLALGFINLVPIPGFDGGWLLFLIIEAVRRRRMDPRNQLIANGVGWALIILVMVLITLSDINHLSGGGVH